MRPLPDWLTPRLRQLESETGESEEREGRLFPDPEHRDMKVTCHYLTADFLIYGTDVSVGGRVLSPGARGGQ